MRISRFLGITLLLLPWAILNPIEAAPEWRPTHFGACFSEEVIMQAEGSWWYYQMGRGINNPVRYGGSYMTSSMQVSSKQFGSRRPESIYNVNGLRLRNADGSWVKGLYLPMDLGNEICGNP